MALLTPANRAQSYQRNYSGRPTTAWGTLVRANATIHLLGSITELVAATDEEYTLLRLRFHGSSGSATNSDMLCNIYLGAAGSETLLIDSLQVGWTASVSQGCSPREYVFPIRIPRGSRISAASRAVTTQRDVWVMVDLGHSNGDLWVGSGVETLGETTASSRGTAVTPGSTSEGSATLIGTTGYRYRYLTLGIQGNNDTTVVAGWTVWDVTNSGGTVLQGMENYVDADNATEYFENLDTGWPCDIPSGTSLYLRAQSNTTASGLQYACIYGVY